MNGKARQERGSVFGAVFCIAAMIAAMIASVSVATAGCGNRAAEPKNLDEARAKFGRSPKVEELSPRARAVVQGMMKQNAPGGAGAAAATVGGASVPSASTGK